MSPNGTPESVSLGKIILECYVTMQNSKKWISDSHDDDFTRDFLEYTFTILGRCSRTGALGVITATGEMAVGSRVPFVEDGAGAIATQALTDPRLGRRGLKLLKEGRSATDTLERLAAADPHIDTRQLGIVDIKGNVAARTGSSNSDWKGHIAKNGFVSMGNRLVSKSVVHAMAECFQSKAEAPIWERLMATCMCAFEKA